MQPFRSARQQIRPQPGRHSRWALALVATAAAVAGLGASPLTGAATDAPAPAAEVSATAGGTTASMTSASVPLDTSSAEQALLDLTNADRAQNSLAPLILDPATLVIARERAVTQLTVPALSHYDSAGQLAFVGLLSKAGVDYHLAGENLARSTDPDASVTQRVEDALMHSPTHRKNILEQTFTRLAIGAATDDHGRIAFAEIFRAE